MNTFTKLTFAGITAICLAVGLTQTQAQTSQASERIGIYDSRAVAVAYSGSAAHNQVLRQLKAERDQAKAAGDTDKVKKIEGQGKAMQKRAHKQAFSTESVDEYLQQITNALPQIQKDAGVTTLISKWNEAELKKHPKAQQVDVTMQLVDAFHPDEKQRKSAIEIQKHKPISLEQAERIND